MTLEGVAEIAAAVLAIWAAIKSIPSPPVLDWRHLFKYALTNVLRGEVEAQEGTIDVFVGVLALWVPYHPAARAPEQKLAHPSLADLPTPLLDGERALVEALARLPDAQARWAAMFADKERIANELIVHPDDLGDDYQAERAFGAGADWDTVSTWNDAPTRLQQRFGHLVVISIGGGIADVMGEASGLRAVAIATADATAEETLVATIEDQLVAASDRLVLVLEADGAHPALRALRSHPGLRDRVVAIVSLGAELQANDEQKTWMEENFNQDDMDTELNRTTPYFCVQLVDPSQPLAVDWAAQRWPAPKDGRAGRTPIAVIDLGAVPAGWVGEPARRTQLARALWTLLAFRLQD